MDDQTKKYLGLQPLSDFELEAVRNSVHTITHAMIFSLQEIVRRDHSAEFPPVVPIDPLDAYVEFIGPSLAPCDLFGLKQAIAESRARTALPKKEGDQAHDDVDVAKIIVF